MRKLGLLCACLLLALVVVKAGSGCRVKVGGSPKLAASGPAEWLVDGTRYSVRSTYYLTERDVLRFVVEYDCGTCAASALEGRPAQLAATAPLMQHAYQSGVYNRVKFRLKGTGDVAPSELVVIGFAGPGSGEKLFTVARPIKELEGLAPHP